MDHKNKISNDYFELLEKNIFKHVKLTKPIEKINGELEIIPTFQEYNQILKYNYNIKQLKLIAKEYKLKIIGNKQQMVSKIYLHLYLSNFAVKIQKYIRGFLCRKYIDLHGPGFNNKSKCTNNFDFLSMDELTNIPNEQFFSFKDNDGFIYGFDIMSLYNLIHKTDGIVKNPFNQQPLPPKVIQNMRSLLRISNVLKIKILTKITDISHEVTDKKYIELKTVTLFQNIDALGNYSNAQWFLSLNRTQLIKFMRELIDIWEYRANISIETKKAICFPSGNPFNRLPNLQIIENIDHIRKAILEVMEKMVNTGIDKDNKCLGAYYILSALTLVNNDAATALPWLYEVTYYA
jgi:hypothetical protein